MIIVVFEEKSVSSQEVFDGKLIKVKVDEVALPNGETARRELVEHPDGVGIVAVTENRDVLMVRQYRKAIEKAIYEIPAGKVNEGENHKDCGIRELEEETGFKAKNFKYLGFIYPSPGFMDEKTHIYLATDLYEGKVNPDPDEYLDILKMPILELEEKILNNEISDAKTVAGVLKAVRILEK